jgi:hypothetical protein
MIMATTRRMWIKPPSVYAVTSPTPHRISKTIAIVVIMVVYG